MNPPNVRIMFNVNSHLGLEGTFDVITRLSTFHFRLFDSCLYRLLKSFAFGAMTIACCNAEEIPSTSQGDTVKDSVALDASPKTAKSEEEDWRNLFGAKQFRQAEGKTLPYRLLVPDGFPNSATGDDLSRKDGQLYPLVLFLHGAGERGDDNEKQLVHGAEEFAKASRREKHPAFVVFPQCPADERWVESDWNLPSGRGEFPPEPSGAMTLTLRLIDELVTTLPVDPKRVYVTGLSMGGMGSWYAVATRPEKFAAMLEVCGGGDPTWAERYAGIPIWAFHGQADTVVPVIRGREMIQALGEAGHWPELRYSEYPGVGHNSWTQTFARDDVYEWLFSHRKP